MRPSRWSRTGLTLCAGLAASAVLGSCKNRPIPPPYKIGLFMQATQDAVINSVDYKVIEGGTPIESKGTFGSGVACSDAAASSGARRSSASLNRLIQWEVVGETPWDHPLLPGNDFSRTWLSVLEGTTRTTGNQSTFESFNNPDVAVPDYQETSYSDLTQTHESAYWGVGADDYVIKVSALDLWNGLEDTGVNQGPLSLDTSPDWYATNNAALPTVQLMTRHKPRNGDVWSSTNGQYVYFYTGHDKVRVGEDKFKSDRVLIKTTGNADPAAGGLINLCLLTGRDELVTDNPDTGINSSLNDIVNLDNECTGSFAFQVVGNEWWSDEALLKQTTTTHEVTVKDWGYEWYEFNAGGTACARFTSTVKGATDAKLFMEYTVDSITSVYNATLFGRLGKKERGPAEEAAAAAAAPPATGTATGATGTATGATPVVR